MTPITAASLLERLNQDGIPPSVRGHSLAFPPTIPADLLPVIRALQTGMRSILTDRPWFGCSVATGWAVRLEPAAAIPSWVGLLSCSGDRKWHRIPPDVRLDHPELFFTESEPKPGQRLRYSSRQAPTIARAA